MYHSCLSLCIYIPCAIAFQPRVCSTRYLWSFCYQLSITYECNALLCFCFSNLIRFHSCLQGLLQFKISQWDESWYVTAVDCNVTLFFT